MVRWVLVQELGVDEGVAGEAAAVLEEGKGALLASPSFGSKSVRAALSFAANLRLSFVPPPLKFGFLQPEDAEKLCFAFVLYCVSKLKETKAGSSGVRLWEILKGCKLKWVMLCYNGF